jgi:putative endonuclease
VQKFYTYIIESTNHSRWYIGHTNNIIRRLFEHNSGQNVSTRNIGKWELIFLREFDTKIEANRFELELKRLRNKNFIKKKYSQFFIVT